MELIGVDLNQPTSRRKLAHKLKQVSWMRRVLCLDWVIPISLSWLDAVQPQVRTSILLWLWSWWSQIFRNGYWSHPGESHHTSRGDWCCAPNCKWDVLSSWYACCASWFQTIEFHFMIRALMQICFRKVVNKLTTNICIGGIKSNGPKQKRVTKQLIVFLYRMHNYNI